MKELNEIVARLDDKYNHHPVWFLSDLQTLVNNANKGDDPFDVSQEGDIEPIVTYILAKLLQRIDKLEDEVHELRSRID